ncbi:hypothetical protein GRAN_3346 [Granulicella sibirica]|uniref:Uncharacterized protein n=1 Tax=Granulicella sibirica TaxID=2479048 RepID=A0A4Q0T3D9_9BACT|nr:hypothetical protein GRAN_3346 [Granulicella sibirica]
MGLLEGQRQVERADTLRLERRVRTGNGKYNGNGKRRFPSGMTTRGANATATAGP